MNFEFHWTGTKYSFKRVLRVPYIGLGVVEYLKSGNVRGYLELINGEIHFQVNQKDPYSVEKTMEFVMKEIEREATNKMNEVLQLWGYNDFT